LRIGVDFGGTNYKLGLFSSEGEMVKFEERKVSDLTQEGDLLLNLINSVKNFCSENKITQGGFATKGLVNSFTGMLEEDIGIANLFSGRNIRDEFSKLLNAPFVVDNDARAYAWGEWKFGAGVGSESMVCMTLGTGLGCALILNGKPFRGSDPVGGLLGGHISIDRNGPECVCGNTGCLESYCSATALIKAVQEEYQEFKNVSEVLPAYFEEYRKNRVKYEKVLKQFISDLAIGIVNVIHAYGPDTIVIGGGVMNSADSFLDDVISLVNKKAWTFPREKVKIKTSMLGNKAAVIGAAFLPEPI
jgi:glucokinase